MSIKDIDRIAAKTFADFLCDFQWNDYTLNQLAIEFAAHRRKATSHICQKCDDTGFLFGAQNWSEAYIKKHGNPYYTADCDCEGAKEKRKQYKQRGRSNE